ncbi:MAG TPA: hypothetical protein PKY10_09945 [Lentisphaeria bacterium]|nr:hypothetical protein [Lentisphaeria bacterium]
MMTRREFITSAIRLALVAFLARLLFQSARTSRAPLQDRCRSKGVCRGCHYLATCGHPTARSFREATR